MTVNAEEPFKQLFFNRSQPDILLPFWNILGSTLNLLASIRLSNSLDANQVLILKLAIVSLFISAVGFFYVTKNLDDVKNECIRLGVVHKEHIEEQMEIRLKRLRVGLITGVAAGFIGLALLWFQ